MCKKQSYNRILDEHLHVLTAQGNHDAYQLLVRRYQNYNKKLSYEILEKYPGTGISFDEIMVVCANHFNYVVRKYNPELCSFYSFWKGVMTKEIMDYIIKNSYNAGAKSFRGSLILDDENDERIAIGEVLKEEDEDSSIKEKIKIVMKALKENKETFKNKEFSILYLLLLGYEISDLEKAGIMKRSTLYLTFKNALNKLKKIIKNYKKDW